MIESGESKKKQAVAFVRFGHLWTTLKDLSRLIASSQVLQNRHETLGTLGLSITRKASQGIPNSMMYYVPRPPLHRGSPPLLLVPDTMPSYLPATFALLSLFWAHVTQTQKSSVECA